MEYIIRFRGAKEEKEKNDDSFFEQLDLLDFRDDLRYK